MIAASDVALLCNEVKIGRFAFSEKDLTYDCCLNSTDCLAIA